MARHEPKWASVRRQLYLARITLPFLLESGWQLDLLTGEFYHPELEALYNRLIANWQEDDRAEREALWQAEQREIHNLAEVGRLKGEFNFIARDIFFDRQPQFYVEGLGISGLTFIPFAKVRLASSFVALYVDLDDALRGLSKNQRRKAIRYKRPLPQSTREAVEQKVSLAVRHFRR